MAKTSSEPSDPGESEPRAEHRDDFTTHLKARRAELERHVQATKAQLDATNERIRARTGRDLVLAILIGLALGGLLLVSLLLVKWLFLVFGGLLVCFAAYEFASALRVAGRRVPRIPTLIATAAVLPAAYFLPTVWTGAALVAGIVLVTLWRLAESLAPSRRVSGRALARDLASGAFVQLYVTLLGAFALLLASSPGGQWWTLAFLIVVVATDTGAYASGLAFGRHPMAPRISPKKTWEGFAGAASASVVAGILLAVFMLDEPWWFGVVFGLSLLITATVGDLAESMIKRDLGIKDMSSWLPGHGGILDRLDSILPSAALAFALFVGTGHGL